MGDWVQALARLVGQGWVEAESWWGNADGQELALHLNAVCASAPPEAAPSVPEIRRQTPQHTRKTGSALLPVLPQQRDQVGESRSGGGAW